MSKDDISAIRGPPSARL